MTTTAIRSLDDAPDPADDRIPDSTPLQIPGPTTLRAIPAGPGSVPDDPAEWPRDRVISRVLAEGLIDVESVAGFRTTWSQTRDDGSREPFWRFVARQDGVDRGRILRTAATAYGFRSVRVSLVGTLGLLDYLQSVWPTDAISRLAAMSAVPVAAEEASASARLMIASDDPCRPDLGRFMDSLVAGPYELLFVSETDLAECFEAVRSHLPDLIPDGLVRLGRATSVPMVVRRAA